MLTNDEHPARLDMMQSVVARIAMENSVSTQDIFGKGRLAEVTRARKKTYVALFTTGFSPSEIARFMERDPSTVSKYIRGYLKENENNGAAENTSVVLQQH